MSEGVRTGLTLLVLTLLLVVAGVWAWSAVTEPFPEEEAAPICVETEVEAGTPVTRDQVVVSVFNGSGRNGLASATQDMLVQRGFVAGDTGNAPRKTDTTLILSGSPRNPAVQLVLRQFRGAKVARGRNLGDGVVVVVGESFRRLRAKAVDSVKVRRDATICRATGSPS